MSHVVYENGKGVVERVFDVGYPIMYEAWGVKSDFGVAYYGVSETKAGAIKLLNEEYDLREAA